MLDSLSSILPVLAHMAMPDPLRQVQKDSYINLAIGGLKFLIGLGLFLAYRFDKAAALQAAQSATPEA